MNAGRYALHLAMVVFFPVSVVLLSPQVCSADATGNADPYSTPDKAKAHPGLYSASDGPKDVMTTDVRGTVDENGVSSLPENPTDRGAITWTIRGVTVTFEHRSPGWGCFYAVSGTRMIRRDGLRENSNKAVTWHSAFDNTKMPRIVLEINTLSRLDDYIGLGVTWTEVDVRLLDGEPNLTYTFQGLSTVGDGQIAAVDNDVHELSADAPVHTFQVTGTHPGLIGLSVTGTILPVTWASGEVVPPIALPSGDPTVNPTFPASAGPNDTNEIVFGAGDGPLSSAMLVCEAERVLKDLSKLRWEIEGDDRAEWYMNYMGDPRIGVGGNNFARYPSLPSNNEGFGLRTVVLTAPAIGPGQGTQLFELFYHRDATNHPDGQAGSPNWFHYWLQAHPDSKIEYVYVPLLGQLGTAGSWNYESPVDKQTILIGTAHPAAGRSYTVGKYRSGIDNFIATVVHEQRHRFQLSEFDAMLATSGTDSFRYGWSINHEVHNHWTFGPDGKWGEAGEDDDYNGVTDDAVPEPNDDWPPWELGYGDDIDLSHPNCRDWPATWTWPAEQYNSLHPIEGDAVQATDAAVNEHQYAPWDWGYPGKNHRTLNKWDGE